MKEAASLREADPRHFARLADRVAMVDGQSQLFGTYATLGSNDEIVWDPPAEGTLADVDHRRRAIGLPPLLEDLAEPPDAAPYRYMRKTPAFAWPPPRHVG